MSTPGPDRRTLLVGGLAVLAGCAVPQGSARTPSPQAGAPVSPAVVASPSTGTVPGGATGGLSGSSAPVATPTPVTPTLDFRAMTYNILSGARPASAFPQVRARDIRFENRVPVLAEWILDAAPDVLAIQENEPMRAPVRRPLRRLLPLLGGYRAVQADTDVPIVYRADVFRALDSGVRVISRTRHLRNGSWCRLEHRATGRRILVANTHLDPHQDAAVVKIREESLRRLTAWLGRLNARHDLPVMLLGDFNTLNNYDADHRLVGVDAVYDFGLRNAADLTPVDASTVPGAASFNVLGTTIAGRFRYGAIRQDGRTFDYIWVGPAFAVRSWQVYTGPKVREVAGTHYVTGIVPSDHCPVLAEVSLPLR
jgi:endonuclease/exonuclease/phosphatase family metal-dependent hydrolase